MRRLLQRRGDQPKLHGWTTNTPAIALDESLGFVVRAEGSVALVKRPPA